MPKRIRGVVRSENGERLMMHSGRVKEIMLKNCDASRQAFTFTSGLLRLIPSGLSCGPSSAISIFRLYALRGDKLCTQNAINAS